MVVVVVQRAVARAASSSGIEFANATAYSQTLSLRLRVVGGRCRGARGLRETGFRIAIAAAFYQPAFPLAP